MVTRFEDLICWQAARELVKLVFTLCSKRELAKEYVIKGQLKSAGLSSMNNISEGFARYHKKDSIRFYDMAQSSAAEVKSMSYAIEDIQLLEPHEIKELREKAEKTRNLTLGFIKYLDKQDTTSNPSLKTHKKTNT